MSDTHDILSRDEDGSVPNQTRLLKAATKAVLTKMQDPADASRFSEYERYLAEQVLNQSEYALGNTFNVACYGNPPKIRYIFQGSFSDITDHADMLPLVCAHEMKHAMLFQEASETPFVTAIHKKIKFPGHMLDQHLRDSAVSFEALNGLWQEQHTDCDSYAWLAANGVAHAAASIAWLGVTCVTAPILGYISRLEEKECDAFAISVNPETDVAKANEWLLNYEKKNRFMPIDEDDGWPERALKKTVNFIQAVKEVVTYPSRTHPAPAERCRHMMREQQKIKSGGASK